MDLPERTYRDWVSRLKKHQYIKTKRAPNGLIFFVNKAKKRFGQKIRDRQKSAYGKKDVDNPVENHVDNLGTGKRDVQKTQVGYAEKVGSDVQKTPDPYMYNNTVDNTIQDNIVGDNKKNLKRLDDLKRKHQLKPMVSSLERTKVQEEVGAEIRPSGIK